MKNMLFLVSTSNQEKIFETIIPYIEGKVYIHTTEHLKKGGIKKENILIDDYFPITRRNKIKNFLEKNKISALIVGNDLEPIAKEYIEVAKENGVKTILIQDGIINTKTTASKNYIAILKEYNILFLFERILNRIFNIVRKNKYEEPSLENYQYGKYADYIFVWGNFTKKTLEKAGIPREKMIITGAPSIAINKNLKEKFMIKHLIYAPSDGIGCGYASEEEYASCIKIIIKIAEEKNIDFIFRPHPRMVLRNDSIISKYKKYIKEFDLSKVPNSILITDASTMGLESIIMGIPLIIMELEKLSLMEPFPEEYIKTKVACYANSYATLKRCLEKYNYKEFIINRNKFLKEHIENYGEDAAKKIAKTIKEIIEK